MPVNTMISVSKAHCRIRKQWKYDPSELRGICATFEHDKSWKSLPFGTIRRIRELRLNRKPKRKHRCRVIPPEKRKVSKRNLIPVQLSDNYGNYVSVNFTFKLINATSLRNKCEQMVYYLKEQRSDFAVITETWLDDSDLSMEWVKTCDLNMDPYRIKVQNWSGRKGGGIALVHKLYLSVKENIRGTKKTFEFASWKISGWKKVFNVLAIYHPPDSNGNSVNAFIDEIAIFLTEFLVKYTDTVIMVDFNMHINDPTDRDAMVFMDTLEAMGLDQNITFDMHQKGNTLDLVFMEVKSSLQVNRCDPGPFISDHRAVLLELSIWKVIPPKLKKLIRDLHKVMDDDLITNFCDEKVSITDDLDLAVSSFNDELKWVLDIVTPEKEKVISMRKLPIWYDEAVREQHCIMNKHE